MVGRAEREQDPDHELRAVLAGAAAAPILVLLGSGVGLAEGGLLPGACQGLACLFSALVLLAAGVVAGTWLVVWAVVHLARRRWPRSRWRLWLLRSLALLSWAPVLWLVVVALE